MLLPKLYFDDSLDNFFENDFNKMKCDIYEEDNKYYVELDLPGFKKEEIKIECNKGNLIITASKEEKNDAKNENRKYIKRERIYNKYSRSFYLGDVDEENINAKFSDGILKVIIPKKDENESKKIINID